MDPTGTLLPSGWRLRAVVASALVAVVLACSGGPAVGPECLPPPMPAGRVTTARENAQATPAWAAGFTRAVAVVDVFDPPVRVPQLREIPDADGHDADGGPLVCTLDLDTDRGLPVAALAVDGTEWRVSFPGEARGFVIPAWSSDGRAHLSAAVAKTTCEGLDPFWLIVAGLPIPRCRDSEEPSTDADVAWHAGYASGPLRCRPMSRAEADRAVEAALADVAGAARSICITEQQGNGPDRMHSDDGLGHLMDAAALVGWADPRVKAYEAWFTGLAVVPESPGKPEPRKRRKAR